MVKKMIAIMLILFFSASICFSAFAANTKTQQEKDNDQARSVRSAIGIVAIVGALFMISKIGRKSHFLTDNKKDSFNFGAIDYDSAKTKDCFGEEKNSPAMGLKVNYVW